MPLVYKIRRGLDGKAAVSSNEVTAIFRGSSRMVVETAAGWRTPAGLVASGRTSRGAKSSISGSGRGRRKGRGRGGAAPEERPAYSNLQLTLSRPHEEIAIIVAGYDEIQADRESMSGTLKPHSAGLLLVHPGQPEVEAISAAGRFRLWFEDDNLLRYRVVLEGVIRVKAAGGSHDIEVQQTEESTPSDLGTTRLEVPYEAWKMLGG